MPAIAYLRRSRVDTRRPGDISHEQQLDAIRALATRHGDDPDQLLVIEDWGRSGRAEKQHLRAGFARLEELVKTGEATAIYAYSASRLARSLEALARLAEACQAARVPIRCADGYSPDVSTATGQMVLGILGAVYKWQADWTRERMNEATALRRKRGDHMGPAPFGFRVVGGKLTTNDDESPDVVLDAYRRAGSLQGAARVLNAEGTRSRGGRPWRASTIRDMLVRTDASELPRHAKIGRPARHAFALAGLLRCPCGAHLTGQNRPRGGISYMCKRAPNLAVHGRPYTVDGTALLAWVKDEAARLQPPTMIATGGEEATARLEELAGRRARVVEAFLDGTINKARKTEELAAIDVELDRLDTTSRIVEVPSIDWTWPAAQINAVLRALWQGIVLDERLRPVSAEWLVPEWRAEDQPVARAGAA